MVPIACNTTPFRLRSSRFFNRTQERSNPCPPLPNLCNALCCLRLSSVTLLLLPIGPVLDPRHHADDAIPVAELDGLRTERFHYGTQATVDLDGFGDSDAAYYRIQQWANGTYATDGVWHCQDRSTVLANGNRLAVPLGSGRYRMDVAVTLSKEGCHVGEFTANLLNRSETYITDEFMVVGNATLTQGTLVQPDAASYNMNLSWAALEGADQYAVSYFKDNTSYQYTVSTATLSLTDSYVYPNDPLTVPTGPGSHSFKLKYCFAGHCSNEIAWGQSLEVHPLNPVSLTAQDNISSNGTVAQGYVKLSWQAESRTQSFKILENGTALALTFPTASTTQVADNGNIIYTHMLHKDLEGSYQYQIQGCANDCNPALYGAASAQVVINQTAPVGSMNAYQIGDTQLTGTAYDLDGPASVRLLARNTGGT